MIEDKMANEESTGGATAQLAQSLRRFREEFNLTQSDVAKKIDMLPQSYRRWELGIYMPRADDIIKLAKAYNVSADYLLGLNDEPRPKEYDAGEVKKAMALYTVIKEIVST